MTSSKFFLEGNNCWPVKKTARGNAGKLLLDTVTENAPMGIVLYQQRGVARPSHTLCIL